jgi:hypothetical protein
MDPFLTIGKLKDGFGDELYGAKNGIGNNTSGILIHYGSVYSICNKGAPLGSPL